jgi:hypothetical protein
VVRDPAPYTTQPIANARRRPIRPPTVPPVIMKAAITSVYRVMAVWMPVTVVPRSLATLAMDTFITELSRVIRNWPVASVASTMPPPARAVAVFTPPIVDTAGVPRAGLPRLRPFGWGRPGRPPGRYAARHVHRREQVHLRLEADEERLGDARRRAGAGRTIPR